MTKGKSYLRSLKLVGFKGFERFEIVFRKGENILTGANNAGKSTAISALRLFASAVPRAAKRNPDTSIELEHGFVRGWKIPAVAFHTAGFEVQNLRYDFLPQDAEIILTTSDGYLISILWRYDALDVDSEDLGIAVLTAKSVDGGTAKRPREILKENVPSIAVVPTVTPLDIEEHRVQAATLNNNLFSRKASRYFRNSLSSLSAEEFDEYKAFLILHTPEIIDLELRTSHFEGAQVFSLFYVEAKTRRVREIGWAGDGIQIWIQVIYFIWRGRNSGVLLLDEPDVFLHPDLQRRLAGVIFGESGQFQTVLATHSTEIITEADAGTTLWIDRSRHRSERPRGAYSYSTIGRRLGSSFELGVARALAAPFVLFVEGEDMTLIKQVATKLGAMNVAQQNRYAVIPLQGFSQKERASVFVETLDVLGSRVEAQVLLDSDLRDPASIDREICNLRNSGIATHVWRRRELENYFLDSRAIARASKQPQSVIVGYLHEILDAQRLQTQDEFYRQSNLDNRNVANSAELATRGVGQKFSELWALPDGPASLVDAKLVLRSLNKKLLSEGSRQVNYKAIVKNMRPEDFPLEVREFMMQLEQAIDAAAR